MEMGHTRQQGGSTVIEGPRRNLDSMRTWLQDSLPALRQPNTWKKGSVVRMVLIRASWLLERDDPRVANASSSFWTLHEETKAPHGVFFSHTGARHCRSVLATVSYLSRPQAYPSLSGIFQTNSTHAHMHTCTHAHSDVSLTAPQTRCQNGTPVPHPW